MVQNVVSRPATVQLTGLQLVWAVFWRGLVYGSVDGLLLFALPWIVTWRAFDGEMARIAGKIRTAVIAWLMILLTTTSYHLGYADFRSKKIIQPNIGSTIMAAPTLVTANPVASPIAHVAMHVTAVIHSPYTELFLPPHRSADAETTATTALSEDRPTANAKGDRMFLAGCCEIWLAKLL
jgi:hypothetical protein